MHTKFQNFLKCIPMATFYDQFLTLSSDYGMIKKRVKFYLNFQPRFSRSFPNKLARQGFERLSLSLTNINFLTPPSIFQTMREESLHQNMSQRRMISFGREQKRRGSQKYLSNLENLHLKWSTLEVSGESKAKFEICLEPFESEAVRTAVKKFNC